MPATLSHAPSQLVTRSDLKEIAPPPPTATWKPIAHYDLIQALDRQLAVRDIRIVKEEFALAHDGLRLFGVLELHVPARDGLACEPDSAQGYHFAMGIRTANDRSFATQLAVGARVFVCSNLAFSGDLIAMNRKHTAKFDLNADLSRAVDRYQVHLATFGDKFNGLHLRHLRMWEAKEIVFDAIAQDIMPSRVLPAVIDGYKRHEGDMTAWHLHNIFTSAFKQLAPAPMFQATTRLGQLFGLTER
jgi:hypothetical protein